MFSVHFSRWYPGKGVMHIQKCLCPVTKSNFYSTMYKRKCPDKTDQNNAIAQGYNKKMKSEIKRRLRKDKES